MTSYLWDIADPGEPLVGGWAMDAIAAHLEATFYGHIMRLLITVPPGFSKSSLCNVFFPLWVWIREPHNRFIHASYEQGIPERDNLKCRNIIGHEKFSRYWGDRFRLVVPNTKDRFENNHTGWKMATAVGAKLIGHRGNYIIIDDPNDPSVEHQSGAKRITAVRWFRETVPTRLNNMSRDKIIVIQQRLHMEDVAGTALSLPHENYVHLNIPMEYEPRLYINAFVAEDDDEPESEVMPIDIRFNQRQPPDTSPPRATGGDQIDQICTLFDDHAQRALDADPDCVFWRDPRTRQGELAWPERFPRAAVIKLKKTLGRTMSEAQLQQRPVPRGGNVIKTESWKTWDKEKYPACKFILATLDTAYTEKEQNDPSGLTVWGLFDDEFGVTRTILVYAWTDWLELNTLTRRVLHTCTANDINYGNEFRGLPRFPVDKLVIEGKASGLSVQQELARLLSQGQHRYLSIDMLPAKLLRDDKYARLVSVSHLFENGVVYAPDKEFADAVIDQVGNFPFATHDEYVDCTSMALRWFRDMGFAPTREEVFEEESAVMAYQPKRPPLYGGI